VRGEAPPSEHTPAGQYVHTPWLQRALGPVWLPQSQKGMNGSWASVWAYRVAPATLIAAFGQAPSHTVEQIVPLETAMHSKSEVHER
jgi:hypothetical protein